MSKKITPEDVHSWLKDPVTREFISRWNQMEKDYDHKVHQCLVKSDPQQASYYNAGLDVVREILSGPEDLIEELKLDEGDSI